MINRNLLTGIQIEQRDFPFLQFHFLDQFLNAVALQRDRLAVAISATQSAVLQEVALMGKPISLELRQRARSKSAKQQGQIFIEVHFYFIAWSHVYRILWQGDKTKQGIDVLSLLELLDDSSLNARLIPFQKIVEDFHNRRNDLEHVLGRMAEGVSDLGNLGKNKEGNRIFSYNGKVIDLSDPALSLVEELNDNIETWLSSQSERGKELTKLLGRR